MRRLAAAGLLGAAVLGLSGCTSGSDHSIRAAALADSSLRGGTLRVGVDNPFGTEGRPGSARYALDPQFEYLSQYWELYRCCLLRTLVSYNGESTAEGGTTLRPDLATALPRLSSDGLTWVFHLKRGVHYAPPFQNREITAGDIVRALEREFRLGAHASYAFYYTVIEGANAFAAHKADSISGLEVPDPHTLVVHLTEPTGDLGYRFSLPATAPIPPGADRGHDGGDGRYLVSSGPYMIAGSSKMNFAAPAGRQRPARGWRYRYVVRGRKVVIRGRESLLLVRNPSWDARSDPLRKAYPDRIEVEMQGAPNSERLRNARRIDQGALDVILDDYPTYAQLRRYETSTRLRRRAHVNALGGVDYITMNLAVPPFDDIHVRRALNLALNRTGLARIESGGVPATPTEHVLPDSVEGGLLADYDPYPLAGDLAAARTEMARSRYDRNHDGRCDVSACNVVAIGDPPTVPWLYKDDAVVRRDFARIGVHLTIRHPSRQSAFLALTRPRTHVALTLTMSWLVDYPDGASFAPVLEAPNNVSNLDLSLLGSTARQLHRWGYGIRWVPTVDQKISECQMLRSDLRRRCWAELDQQLTERIVPWLPRDQFEFTEVTSARVARYSFDQFGGGPSLDRIALEPGSR